MSGKLDEAFGIHGAALTLRVKRQQMIASNIANADTPGYRATDFDFSRALRDAIGAHGAAPAVPAATLVRTSAAHVAGATSAWSGLTTRHPAPAQAAADGNTVDMDRERARFADNTVRYEAALRFLNGKIKSLMSAIQG